MPASIIGLEPLNYRTAMIVATSLFFAEDELLARAERKK